MSEKPDDKKDFRVVAVDLVPGVKVTEVMEVSALRVSSRFVTLQRGKEFEDGWIRYWDKIDKKEIWVETPNIITI